MKLLSVDPANYDDAPREGSEYLYVARSDQGLTAGGSGSGPACAVRRIIEEVSGVPLPRDAPIDHAVISSIRMGTTGVCVFRR